MPVSPASGSPLIGIALPVRNGERFIRETLESLLRQSFSDYELLILDNDSSDRTAAIAREYADRDERIRYHLNSENIGPARNFNLGFELMSSRYFKWMAHDDLMHPDFLARCVSALEHDPGAVLAYTQSRIIDARGKPLETYAPAFATDSARAATRFGSLLHDHKCFQIFGVMRREALLKTKLIGLHAHGDGVLLAHLALLGRFVEIPEPLFYPRKHASHSLIFIGDYWSYTDWFDPTTKGRRKFPQWRILGGYVACVARAPLRIRDRAACGLALIRYVGRKWRVLRGDVLFYIRPRLVAMGVSERLLRRSSHSRAKELEHARRR